jgi:hypothetical protein
VCHRAIPVAQLAQGGNRSHLGLLRVVEEQHYCIAAAGSEHRLGQDILLAVGAHEMHCAAVAGAMLGSVAAAVVALQLQLRTRGKVSAVEEGAGLVVVEDNLEEPFASTR